MGSGPRNHITLKDLQEQAHKNNEMTFEACKHFTTLDTAAALIVVAIFRETENGVLGAIEPLFCFAGSLIVCAYGLLVTAIAGLQNNKAAISTAGSLILGASVFFVGLMWTVLAAIP